MAFLEQFGNEERRLLISLPYRAGLWVGACDETGGAESDYKELDKLEDIIAAKARRMAESAFVHEVMAETFTQQSQWKEWAKGLDTVPADCSKALDVMKDRLVDKDINAYRKLIMHIGTEVAKAYREFDDTEPFVSRVMTYIRMAMAKFFSIFGAGNAEDDRILNISVEEDIALSNLAKALRIDH